MLNSKPFIIVFLAILAIGGVSASAVLGRRQLDIDICASVSGILEPDIEFECCAGTLLQISGLPAGAFVGLGCDPTTVCRDLTLDGPFCCVPVGSITGIEVPELVAGASLCFEIPTI
ncbi:hypothetical protein BC834DRAFT_967317 [Gloeopeniophorella convolvens]|nr:hypothetical protein BC834DRAFT_967317 [Gloeopeniophorella convolvens]